LLLYSEKLLGNITVTEKIF